MARALLILLGFGLLLPSAALAHGPSRQKTDETIEINAPVDKVWAAIGNFQDMGWHPAVAKTEGKGGNDIGATRTLTLQGGGKINETLTKYNAEGKTYSYEISEVDYKVLPVSNYSSTLLVKDAGGKSTVEWKGAYYRSYVNNDPPPEQTDDAAAAAVESVYKAGLEGLKKKLEGGS